MTALGLLFALRAAPLSYQTAKLDISPPELLPLGGYSARKGATMEPGGDKLYAQTLLLSQGKVEVAMVSCDMLTIPQSLSDAVRKRLPKNMTLFLAATHTHCAPDSQMLNDRMTLAIPGIASYKPKWLDWYANKIAECVLSAGKAAPHVVKRLTLESSTVDVNRARRPGGDPDPTLSTLVADNVKLLACYSAHATIYSEKELKTRRDWPGALSDAISAPVFAGAIGDVSPKAEGADAPTRVQQMVGALQTAQHLTVTELDPKLSAISPSIKLDSVSAHPEFGKRYGIPDALAKQVALKFAPTSAALSVVRLGKLAIIGVPGEPTSHIGRMIQKSAADPVMVMSHVNGWIGYILDPQDYARGGYEATLSFHGPETGRRVVEAASSALQQPGKGVEKAMSRRL